MRERETTLQLSKQLITSTGVTLRINPPKNVRKTPVLVINCFDNCSTTEFTYCSIERVCALNRTVGELCRFLSLRHYNLRVSSYNLVALMTALSAVLLCTGAADQTATTWEKGNINLPAVTDGAEENLCIGILHLFNCQPRGRRYCLHPTTSLPLPYLVHVIQL
jgi:hypothetical protein